MAKETRGAKVIVKCKCCKEEFSARVADRNRGWAKFCSKSCKAKEQEKRTGQHAEFLRKKEHAEAQEDDCDEELGWDAHKLSSGGEKE